MKVKNFEDYLAKRLNVEEIKELESHAEREYQALKELQKGIAFALESYAKQENIGFNDLVRKLNISPSKLSKIQNGEANLTLASIAHISTLLKRKVVFTFEAETENIGNLRKSV